MTDITFDATIDLADRVKKLEETVASVFSTIETELDAITGRLDSAERTIAAITDALRSAAPESVQGLTAAIEEIKTAVNGFYVNVYGPAGTDAPFPLKTPPE